MGKQTTFSMLSQTGDFNNLWELAPVSHTNDFVRMVYKRMKPVFGSSAIYIKTKLGFAGL